MRLLVCARRELFNETACGRDAALLLEGSWPAEAPFADHWSLDEAIDARFEWIDAHAARLAEQLGISHAQGDGPLDRITGAYLNALSLRYFLVKLLRIAAYFTDIHPLQPGDRVELVVDGGQDYVELFEELCRNADAELMVRQGATGCLPASAKPRGGLSQDFPPNSAWRRLASRIAGLLRGRSATGRRVVLCGNPRVLGPVCEQLQRRGAAVWWLCDRFASKLWLGGRAPQLVCNSSLGRVDKLYRDVPDRFEFRGVNLARPLRWWLGRRMDLHGARQTRLVEQIDRHFARVRPDAVVLCEDATPMARAAVAVARRHEAESFVVQHGVPGCRFGFAPLAAGKFLAWGQSSAERLIDWSVPPERIRIASTKEREIPFGTAWLRGETLSGLPTSFKRILLLGTTPPRDRRPDAVALQMTTASYERMLRMAFGAAASIDGAKLTVKTHPRSAGDETLRRAMKEMPQLDVEVIAGGSVEELFERTDCVLSFASTAGIEAAAMGLPVIELAPPGTDILPNDQWGTHGTARNERELRTLLTEVLVEGRFEPKSMRHVFAEHGNIADEILGDVENITSLAEPLAAAASKSVGCVSTHQESNRPF